MSQKIVGTRLRVHPGEILNEEFILPFEISARSLASALAVPPNRVTEIIRGERSITADTAIRLGKYFGTSSQFWLNLQQTYDLAVAEDEGDYSAIKPREIAVAA